MAKIHFFSEEIDFVIKQKGLLRQWITDAAKAEDFRIGELSFIFCDDEYLLSVNKQFLDHDTYTDIVTFDHSEEEDRLAGDIFISIDRVRDNAATYGISEAEELRRVMIHGVLHLCGYLDKEPADKKQMTQMEDHYLDILRSIKK